MYTREQASLIKQKFWTTLGQFLALHPSAEGLKVNWLNYKTGLKHVYFRMDADKNSAYIGIELHHPDQGIQELFFEQFLEFKLLLHGLMEEEWEWELHSLDEKTGKTISRIYCTQQGYNVFDEKHWADIIRFLSPRMISLDSFWADAKYSFDVLKG